MPALGPEYSFYSGKDDSKIYADVHPCLAGLHTISTHFSVDLLFIPPSASETLPARDLPKMLEKFCAQMLGVSNRAVHEHQLLNKAVLRTWVDHSASGSVLEKSGKIVSCTQDFRSQEKEFGIRYTTGAPGTELVTEEIAWGSYYATSIFAECANHEVPPFKYSWIIPRERFVEPDGIHLDLEHYDFRLTIAVEPSSMKGAGRGVMLTVRDTSDRKRTHFTLPEGVLIDIGQYAPVTDHDFKSEPVHNIKGYIHLWKSDVYRYEDFDVTNDETGELHALAQQRLLCCVNETKGKEIPNVCAFRVPGGGINYYIGQSKSGYGELEIPVGGNKIELKVSLQCARTAVLW